MDDTLRAKIDASIDLPAGTAQDPDVVTALAHDPEAAAYARGIHAIDRLLRVWPEAEQTSPRGDDARARIEARLDAMLASESGSSPRHENPGAQFDFTAPPDLDDPSPTMETHVAMTEPHEPDADLENLAALTRTSIGPGTRASIPPRSQNPAIIDAVDESTSGIVDIKHLASLARESTAPPSAEPPPPAEAKPVDAKPAARNDVMVMAKPAAVAVHTPPPRGNALWGAIVGIGVSAAAFALYLNTRGTTALPTAPAQSELSASPGSPTSPEGTAPQAPPVVAPPPTPEPAPASAAPVAVTAAPATVAVPAPLPTTAPAAQEAPVRASAGQVERQGFATRRTVPAAAPAPTTAAPSPAAHAAHIARAGSGAGGGGEAPAVGRATDRARETTTAAPVPAAAPHVAPTAGAPAAGAAPRSIDDLLAAAAPGHGPAPTAAPTAAADTAPANNLPERLSRPQVFSVMNPLAVGARACTQGQTGTAPVSITIDNTGAVQHATVSGQFAGTAAGDCIGNLVHRAHFPAIRQATQTFMFPFVITPPR